MSVVLNFLRKQAGLDPLPEFCRDFGKKLDDQSWMEFVDHRFFSPAALHYADAAMEHLARDGQLKQRDSSALALIHKAMRAGLKPTAAQERRFRDAHRYQQMQRIESTLVVEELAKCGIPYGPDYELPNNIELPNGKSLFKRELGPVMGLSDNAMDSCIKRWRMHYVAEYPGTKLPL